MGNSSETFGLSGSLYRTTSKEPQSVTGKMAITALLSFAIFFLGMAGLSVNTAVALPGSGTQQDPWRIESLADFNEFAADANYWNGYTRLETDVNLAGQTYSTAVIATDIVNYNFVFDGTVFGGVFDGNDHKITDLTIDDGEADNDFLGLFGCIGEEGRVSNLGLECISISGDFFVGGLVGQNFYGNISKCYSTGDVHGNWDNVGGLVGENNGSISNCYYTGDVSSDNLFVGGLVGANRDGYISDCHSIGNVSGKYSIGGLVGLHSGIGIISNCYSTGDVSGMDKVGGLVGGNYGSVSHCYSKGDVNGTGMLAGGLIGDNAGTVSHCYSTGTVSGNHWGGGLMGTNFGSISHCYSTGDVSGFAFVGGLLGENWETGTVSNCYSHGDVNGSDFVGGLVGDNYGSVSNCYSVGDVNGFNYVGGLVMNNWEYGIISNCFWDIENQTHGVTESIGYNLGTVTNVSGLPTTQMQTKSTFTDAGWDFNDVWYIDEGNNYPVLRSLYVIPKIYHVDGVTGDNTNDGLSRETAFETIQYAIDEANDCGTVLVWPGVYNETATHGINFKGKAITIKSVADAAVLEVPGFTAVSFVQGEDENSVFSNFVVRGSTAGFFALFANPTINNVTVVGNNNGVIADNANPLITNSIFWDNINGDLFGSPDPITAQYSFIQDEVETNLVAYWKLDGDAADSAGSNHGTIYGATSATGQVGGALSFDGDDYVQIADDDSLDISDEITLSAWINPSNTSSIRMIVSKYKDYAGESYLLELKYEKIYLVLGGISSLSGVQNFSTRIWYHVAATYDGSRMRVYTNGELENEQAASGTIPITTQELNIGRQADNNYWPFEGLIDEVRIYDRALSAEEIEAIYEAGLVGISYGEPGFVDANNGDYHLLSERGRYRATTDEWILDEVTSPCVDGGEP
ncbi:MAG: GLUG motif-containing protein, partial [Planctomycetota bacterium]